jgi:antitoxin component HigA of HigAB toxin-antitoxin module
MDANGLRQVDLAEIFGGQPVVSAVLRGERKINLRQARSLGKRFSLDFSAFISDADVGPFKDQPTVIGEELVGYSDSKIFVEMFPRSKPILTASNCSFTRMVRSAKSTSKAKPGIPYRPTPVHPISTYTQNSALYRMDDEQKNTTTSNIVERRQELVACA